MTHASLSASVLPAPASLSWFNIVRLGLVQMCLGAVVVLTTSALNRVMVVELALPAMIPGALVALHHAMQLLRPRMGYGSDVGQRRTPWIVGGMAALATGGLGAAFATALMADHRAAGLALGTVSFALIGGGVSAAGTSLLVLMAKRVAAPRRAASATIVWMMMIMGFAITAGITSKLLDPFSPERLIKVAAGVCLIALSVAFVAIWGVEGKGAEPVDEDAEPAPKFTAALREVWAERDARRFTIFVMVSMLAYSAQDLVLEPFAGTVFSFTLGQSTGLSGTQHQGIFAGMLLVALVSSLFKNTPLASLKAWVIGGCAASAVALSGLAYAGLRGDGQWPLVANVFFLGLANGAFSIAAIGSMMALAGEGKSKREGVRMGVWGSAQAIAFGVGGFLGTIIADVAKNLLGAASLGYAVVFALEATAFVAALLVARTLAFPRVTRSAPREPAAVADDVAPSLAPMAARSAA
jgi:MFS transporter, BCD family, chlorophyll transporter